MKIKVPSILMMSTRITKKFAKNSTDRTEIRLTRGFKILSHSAILKIDTNEKITTHTNHLIFVA